MGSEGRGLSPGTSQTGPHHHHPFVYFRSGIACLYHRKEEEPPSPLCPAYVDHLLLIPAKATTAVRAADLLANLFILVAHSLPARSKFEAGGEAHAVSYRIFSSWILFGLPNI